jgi:hypothetical protein
MRGPFEDRAEEPAHDLDDAPPRLGETPLRGAFLASTQIVGSAGRGRCLNSGGFRFERDAQVSRFGSSLKEFQEALA